MRLTRLASVLLVQVLLLSQAPSAGSGSRREDLDGTLRSAVHNYRLHDVNLVEALVRLASDFRIPMGIEWVRTERAEAKLDLAWENSTVEDVLRTVVRTQPGYKIARTAGIVRICSPTLVPDRVNPLKLNIGSFEVQNVRAEQAARQLHAAVLRKIRPPKPSYNGSGGIIGSGASNVDDPKMSVKLTNATVEEVLDALARTSARKIWIVTFRESTELTPAGYRRTLTLWNDFPIPDDDQPLWDLLHWGDSIPETAWATK